MQKHFKKHTITSLVSLILLFVLGISSQAQEKLPYWKDMNVMKVNTISPRSSFMTYANKEHALTERYEKSSYYQLLNGTWKFYYVDGYKQLPENITDPNTSTANWSDIKVPGNWEVQGFGTPIYVNQPYDFKPSNPTPPILPEENPVGVYRRDISIPKAWEGRDIYLHIAGAKSGVYVYLNGKEVGYHEDSKDPAEYLINPYLKEGNNTLVVKMFRWSTGSFLECQDFFRISGFERDVFLWSQPKTHLFDFRVKSTLDDSYTQGIFALGMDIENTNTTAQKTSISYTLLDKNQKTILSGSKSITVNPNSKETVNFADSIPQVATWNAEAPNLYQLLMTVSQDGKVQEYVPFNVGFRRIEIKESQYVIDGNKLRLFYVNGQPIKLKGVNIHETSQYTGHYVTPEQMRKDFELLKLNNFNSVRLSHYPQDRKFYEMCDKFGIYVYDEANIESHGMHYKRYLDDMRKGTVGHIDGNKKGTLGHNPDWLQNHLYRMNNMFQRNKNFPCVTILSLGNEAGNGYNFYNGYVMMKDLDKDLMQRPVCYERAQWEWNSDMFVPQYPSADWFESMGKKGADRPIVPSEYAHAMGNSTGDFYGQWKAIYKYPQLQGGYIWDWIDQAFLAKGKNGKTIWAYGGDFGTNAPSDGNFVINGLLNPDQTPHPAMAEVKYNLQNVGFEAEDLSKGTIKITNRFYFTNLSAYQLKYQLLKNGVVVKTSNLDLDLGPQETKTISIPISSLKPEAGVEYFVNLSVATKTKDALVPAGHTIAYDQFELPIQSSKTLEHYQSIGAKLSVNDDPNQVNISSKNVSFTFDKKKGIATSYKVAGYEYFDNNFGIQPNFWRGPTDNDYGNRMPKRLHVWKESSKHFTIEKCTTSQEGNTILLHVDYLLAAGNHYLMDYRIYPTGIVNISATFTPVLDHDLAKDGQSDEELAATFTPRTAKDKASKQVLDIPRIGIRFRLPVSMDEISYFGRGPEENYCDRYKGTLVGLYQAKANDLYYPYVRPQENGHHTDTRWIAASNTGGKGLLIKSEKTFGFNALQNSVEDFDSQESNAPYQWNNFSPEEIANRNDSTAENIKRKQTHASDITPKDFVEICLDMKQMGVAGFDSWGSKAIPEARIFTDQEYKWSFTLIPIKSPKDIPSKVTLNY